MSHLLAETPKAKRPSRLELLEYAFDGACVLLGTNFERLEGDERFLLLAHIEWLRTASAKLRFTNTEGETHENP